MALGFRFQFRTYNLQISNRECFRLETGVTRTKQTLRIRSNREKEACFSRSNCRGAGLLRPRVGRGCWACSDGKTQTQSGPVVNPGPYDGGRKKRTRDPQLLFRVEKIRSLIRFNLRRNLPEPMFRVEQVPKRRKCKGRAGIARGDANGRRRGRANPALPYGKTPIQLRDREKTKSRPPAFVAIRKNYVIGSIRLKEEF